MADQATADNFKVRARRAAGAVLPRSVRSAVMTARALLVKQGHYRSIRLGRPVAADGSPIPWFTYPTIAYLEQIDLRSMSVFEYGSGYSTLFWQARALSVVSVEHDPAWFDEMAPRLQGVDNRLIQDQTEYVAAIDGGTYDVIVIDGQWRSACVEPALQALRPGGFIVFDNSDWYPSDAERLRAAGLIEVDFTGFGPINSYTSTTSLFLSPKFHPTPLDVMPRVSVAGIHHRSQG